MQQNFEQFLSIVAGAWRYRWRALTAAWLVCVLGWLLVYSIPDYYQARARVYVDSQSMLKPLLQGLTVNTDVMNTATIMTRALLSRPNLENVVDETGLRHRVKDERQLEYLLAELNKKIEIIEDEQRADLLWIMYTDTDPRLAKDVVDTLLVGFVERTLGMNQEDSGVAQRFLDEQIKEYEVRLEEAEGRLKEFKRQNVGKMPSDNIDYYQRLQAANDELDQARLKLREVANRVRQLQSQVAGEEPVFGFATSTRETPESRAIEKRLNKLKQEQDTLLLRFTEEHPDLVAVRRTIAELEAKKEELAQKQLEFGSTVRAEENPVYQQMKIALGQAQAEAAALRVRVAERKRQVDYLGERVDTLPRVEAELKKLNRDYDVIRKNYEELLSRRESANLSLKAEQTSDDLQFKIIDPPRVPLTPAGPNRLLFISVMLLFGVGAGVAMAFFWSQVNPGFYSSSTLGTAAGRPVLGSVSVSWVPAMRVRHAVKFAFFTMSGLGLVGVFGVLAALNWMGVELRSEVLALIGPML